MLSASNGLIPWFIDFVNYLESYVVPFDLSFHQRKKFIHDMKVFFWDEPYLYQSCADGIIHRVKLEAECSVGVPFFACGREP